MTELTPQDRRNTVEHVHIGEFWDLSGVKIETVQRYFAPFVKDPKSAHILASYKEGFVRIPGFLGTASSPEEAMELLEIDAEERGMSKDYIERRKREARELLAILLEMQKEDGL